MRMKNILMVLIAGALLTMSGTVFAERQDKMQVCHVGSEYGPAPEYAVYMDDPGCVPVEENDYFCPDAGKIDLIEAAKTNNHLSNPNHTFEFAPGEFVSDYEPDPAWGGSTEDTDGNGIDDGCESPAPASNLSCPCWNNYTEASLVAFIDSWPEVDCEVEDNHITLEGYPYLGASVVSGYNSNAKAHDQSLQATVRGPEWGSYCRLVYGGNTIASVLDLDEAEANLCHNEAESVMSQLTFCGGLPQP